MDVRVILVEPKLAENIGAVARVLKNFGFSELYLVNPPAFDEKMFWVASHADDVLRASTVVSSLDDAIAGTNLVVGTTAKTGISASRHLRKPLFSPRELVATLADGGAGGGLLALLFGPEDRGLLNDELVHCDLLVSIPTSTAYPVLNLSHAVAIVLYELYEGQEQQKCEQGSSLEQQQPALAAVADKERLFEHLSRFLEEIEYRAHKRARTMLMLRRLLGRAVLTAREVRTLRGILRSAERKLREQERERERERERREQR
ncbi:MAG: RNA methyltransferase [Methanomicrobia archaeon]|nr:RNA methyltransferase [Methanomicrobia archaeon]